MSSDPFYSIHFAWGALSDMFSSRILGWWYVCIGAGFIALAVRALIAGAQMWAAGLRFAIALGFLTLGFMSLRGKQT
jgi:hypothetical protein